MNIQQYGTRVGPSEWRGRLTGHVFDSEEALIHYEKREALKAQARVPQQSDLLRRFSTADLKTMAEAYAHQAAENARQTSISDEADVFLMRHPEFINNPTNGTKMITALQVLGRQHTGTVEDLELVYQTLCDAGALELDGNALAQQRRAALEERAANEPPPFDGLTEEQLYELPMAELERRANKAFL
jgi:hypothetical protein